MFHSGQFFSGVKHVVSFQSHFVRHNTPHPKELRARHTKLFKKENVDGHVIPHNPEQKKEVGFKLSVGHFLVLSMRRYCKSHRLSGITFPPLYPDWTQ